MELSKFINYWLADCGFKIKQALPGISISPRPFFLGLRIPITLYNHLQIFSSVPTNPHPPQDFPPGPSALSTPCLPPKSPSDPSFLARPHSPPTTFPLLQVRAVFLVKSLLSVKVSLCLVKYCNLVRGFEDLAKWSYFNRSWVFTVCWEGRGWQFIKSRGVFKMLSSTLSHQFGLSGSSWNICIYILAGFSEPVRSPQRGLTIFLRLPFNQHRVVSLQIKTDF